MTHADYLEKRKFKNLVCTEHSWESWPMWILNICIFASTSENGALILYLKKKIRKFPRHWKYFCLLAILPFNPMPSFLEKIFHQHPYCQIGGSQSPLYKGWALNYAFRIFADYFTTFNSNLYIYIYIYIHTDRQTDRQTDIPGADLEV